MKRAINICLNTEDIVVIFARYGAEKKALEQAEIDDKTDVYIVDFSFSREDTLDIAKKCKNLVILDHHITALEKLEGIEKESDNIEFFFDNNMSGATLVNGFVAKRFLDFGKSQVVVNYVAAMVEDRDLWNFKLEDTKPLVDYDREIKEKDLT
jgi:oligoribonuclease NrnB/cAMP/cGMP phosphodiesterase (DHH superfamily)